MRVARLVAPRTFQLEEHPAPVLQEGEVLIRLQRLSICGSDMRRYRKVLPEEEYPLEFGMPCHECAGVVEDSLCDEFTPGQRVIVLPLQLKGLTEYLVSSPDRIIPLPDNGDLSTLLMCQPFGTVLYSCSRAGNVIGNTVVIQGQGAIGLSFAYLMARQGAAQVITVDPLQYRLDKSKKVGATHAFNPLQDDVLTAVADLTGGEMADLVVEAAGTPETVNRCLDLVRKGGTVVLFGLTQEDIIPFEYFKMTRRYPVIIPTTSSATEDPTLFIKEAVSLVKQGRLDPSWLITHRMSFDDVQRAYDMYEARTDNSLKVVMEV